MFGNTAAPLFLSVIAFALATSCIRNPETIIPHPKEISLTGGTLLFSKTKTPVISSVDTALSPSSYSIDILKDSVIIKGGDEAGVLYARQSLEQLTYKADESGTVRIKCSRILDWPVFEYRGLMLDVARHFYSVDEIKSVLDIMALHKLNYFHWHLTDDQGWRIEIKAYPRLTSTGSVRRRTLIGKDPGGEYDGTEKYEETPYGGYYTQEQIKEILEYAGERQITVIPEIEFPGHAVAALASYPELGCTGEQYEVRQTWDIDDRVFCIGKESTFGFMENVLSEVAALFPSPYIHIGGDECPDKMWRRCPHCNERMQKEGLQTFRQLQGYAVARLADFLEQHGKSVIGWDEILDAGVDSTAIVMSWRGAESGIKAALSGNKVIMSPTEYSYFDYYQFPENVAQPLAWGGYLPIEKVYEFDPYRGLTQEQRNLVLGVQANLWTEYISGMPHLEYMMLPRLAAFSETAWSPEQKNLNRFLTDSKRFEEYYSYKGYNYANMRYLRNDMRKTVAR